MINFSNPNLTQESYDALQIPYPNTNCLELYEPSKGEAAIYPYFGPYCGIYKINPNTILATFLVQLIQNGKNCYIPSNTEHLEQLLIIAGEACFTLIRQYVDNSSLVPSQEKGFCSPYTTWDGTKIDTPSTKQLRLMGFDDPTPYTLAWFTPYHQYYTCLNP